MNRSSQVLDCRQLCVGAILSTVVSLLFSNLSHADVLYIQSGASGTSSHWVNVYNSNFTLTNTLFPYPEFPTNATASVSPKDLVVDAAGRIHQYNGEAFKPYLSTRDAAGNWIHRTHTGWSMPSITYYGGIGQIGNNVYVPSVATAVAPFTGIIAFNLDSGTSQEFASGFQASDIAVGLDGSLWALSATLGNSRNTVQKYDPVTFQLLRSIAFENVPGSSAATSIAVDANGDFFVGSSGFVSRFDSNGIFQQSLNMGPGTIGDIDISSTGQLALGTTGNGTWISNRQFSGLTQIESGRLNSFVTFQAVPEPSSIILLTAGSVAFLFNRSRRKSR